MRHALFVSRGLQLQRLPASACYIFADATSPSQAASRKTFSARTRTQTRFWSQGLGRRHAS
jgi:hypothetical protein